MLVETQETPTTTDPEVSFHSNEFELSDKGADLLDQIDRFISRYLECSDSQRIIMAYWVLHTHCLDAAQVTPYLAIQSAEKQSGKSLCLQLLSMIAAESALTTSYTASSLSKRTDGIVPTVLLDEFQATIGTRARSKSPLLRAVLSSGFQDGVGYTTSTGERNLFAAKAFAGMGQLPQDIAERSISVVLEPLTSNSKVRRFDLLRATEDANDLRGRLISWAEGVIPILKKKPPYSRDKFPPNLSPRQQDMIEPLLEIADFLGEGWSDLVREALVDSFQEQSAFELKESLQVLADIRDCFAHHGYTDRLSTSLLLGWLHSRPSRPWDVDGPITARRFAHLLLPFDVFPRVQRIGKTIRSRGYQLQDFIEHWQKHLHFELPPNVTHEDGAEIASKNAPCHPVTHSDEVSKISADQRESAANGSGVGFVVGISQGPRAKGQELSELEASSQKLVAASDVTHHQQSQIPNKDAGCHAVTLSDAIPESRPSSDGHHDLSPLTCNLSPDSAVTPTADAEIPNKNAYCHAVTLSREGFGIGADQRSSAAGLV